MISGGQTSPRALKLIAVTEVVTSLAGIQIAIWVLAPRFEAAGMLPLVYALAAVAALYLFFLSPAVVHGDLPGVRGLGGWRTAFIRTDNLRQSAVIYGTAAAAAVAFLFAGILLIEPARLAEISWRSIPLKFGLYLISTTLQGLFWLGFVLVRLRGLFSRDGRAGESLPPPPQRWAICLLCASLFSLCHAPNPALMALTFVMGGIICRLYLSTPNILAAIVCQTVIGTALHRIIGLHMMVGPFYSQTEAHPLRTLLPFTKKLIGDMW